MRVLQHPLLARDVAVARSRCTDAASFRSALQRIGYHLAIAALEHVSVEPIEIETPLEKTTGYRLAQRIVLVPIVRAGLVLLEPFLHVVPDAAVGYIGLRRNEQTLEPTEYYWNVPALDGTCSVVVLDPMLATGGSSLHAVQRLLDSGARDVTVAAVIAAPEGVERLELHVPHVRIVTAALDRELNDRGFILPGLGDAGDRAFGTRSTVGSNEHA